MSLKALSYGNSGRRQFLQAVLTSAAVAAAAQAGFELANPEEVIAQTNLTPDAALQELLAGNRRFAADQMTSIDHDLTMLKDHTVAKQEPLRNPVLRRFSRPGGTGLRPNDRPPLRHPSSRQHSHTRNYRQPRIRSSSVGSQSSARTRPQQLRSSKGVNESRSSARANQHAIRAHSPSSRTVRRQCRKSDRTKRKNPSRIAAYILPSNPRRSKGRQPKSRIRSLRSSHRQGHSKLRPPTQQRSTL